MVITAVLALAISSVANAQGYGPPRGYYGPPGIQRYGLVFGGSIGPGVMNFSDCHNCDSLGTLAVQLEIGGMVAPNVALLFDWTGHFHPDHDGTLSANLFTGDIRFFFARILWIQGGIGVGSLSFDNNFGYDNVDIGWGVGGLGAIGVELLQTRRMALDLQLRLSAIHISNDSQALGSYTVEDGAIMIGLHWY
jgi:hypothetical protein